MSITGRFKAEHLVGALCIMVVLEHPEHQLGHSHLAIDVGKPVQQSA